MEWASIMRINETTVLIGEQIVLVPYRKEHVVVRVSSSPVPDDQLTFRRFQQYHEWMKSPDLLEATASEPLSLEEEYTMQQKWHLDDDKLTFIILALSPSLRSAKSTCTSVTSSDLKSCQMIGDVNLFLPDGPQGEDVECEIMIAESSFRHRGIAREALSLLFNYATSPSPLLAVPANSLMARIGTANEGSIKLFQNLGFRKVKLVEVFQEVEVRFGWDEEAKVAKATSGKWPSYAAKAAAWDMAHDE